MANLELHCADGHRIRICGPGSMGLGTTACERPLCTTHARAYGINLSRVPHPVGRAELLPLRRRTVALRVYADSSRVNFAGRRDQCDCVAVWFWQTDHYHGDFSRLLPTSLV